MTRSDSDTSVHSPLCYVDLAGRAGGLKPPFSSILVDIDTKARSQPALGLAAVLARRPGAQLRIVDASSRSGDRFSSALSGASGFARSAFDLVRHEMAPPHETLIEEVRRFGHDLVIRSQERDWIATSAGRKYSVNDRLFRHCPCPVWTVGVRPNLNNPRILIAVNPVSADPITKVLDAGAIRLALVIRSLLGGDITVFHVWRQPGEKKPYLYLTEAEVESWIRATERQTADALVQFVDSFGHSTAGLRIELKRGAAEEIIPAFVVSEGIDIVITGARAETGIWRLLFGSTAERLLKATPCSVIAYKADARSEKSMTMAASLGY